MARDSPDLMELTMVVGILWLFALINLAIGVGCLVDPLGLLEPVGVGALNSGGVVELRAMYGGMLVGFGGFLGWCALDAARARLGLLASVCTVGGLGFSRLVAWTITMPEGMLFPILFVVEIGGAVVGIVALWRTR
jgi:hypothetical protein